MEEMPTRIMRENHEVLEPRQHLKPSQLRRFDLESLQKNKYPEKIEPVKPKLQRLKLKT